MMWRTKRYGACSHSQSERTRYRYQISLLLRHNFIRRNAPARLSATTAFKMSLEERLTKIRASPKLQSVQQVRLHVPKILSAH
jgi:hypothetical protein